jgi:uncharacterized DUF497 family protein
VYDEGVANAQQFSELTETTDPSRGPEVHVGQAEGCNEPDEAQSRLRGGRNHLQRSHSITVEDELHSFDEVRYFTIGRSAHGRLLSVAHMEDEDRIRIISARPATRAEARTYDEP